MSILKTPISTLFLFGIMVYEGFEHEHAINQNDLSASCTAIQHLKRTMTKIFWGDCVLPSFTNVFNVRIFFYIKLFNLV